MGRRRNPWPLCGPGDGATDPGAAPQEDRCAGALTWRWSDGLDSVTVRAIEIFLDLPRDSQTKCIPLSAPTVWFIAFRLVFI